MGKMNIKTAKQFIKDHQEGLNGTREDKPEGAYYNLRGKDLSGENLEYADLSGANLKSTNLEGTNIEGADFEGADLEGINIDLYDEDIKAISPFLIEKIIELKGKEGIEERLKYDCH